MHASSDEIARHEALKKGMEGTNTAPATNDDPRLAEAYVKIEYLKHEVAKVARERDQHKSTALTSQAKMEAFEAVIEMLAEKLADA